jgi:hypothetical protein
MNILISLSSTDVYVKWGEVKSKLIVAKWITGPQRSGCRFQSGVLVWVYCHTSYSSLCSWIEYQEIVICILYYYWRVIHKCRSIRGRCRMLVGLAVQSMPITSKVASWNPDDGEVYSIQHYVIEFVSDLQQVCRFLQVLQFPLQIKLTAKYLTEILLKVALNTITLTLTLQKCIYIYTPTVIIIQKW